MKNFWKSALKHPVSVLSGLTATVGLFAIPVSLITGAVVSMLWVEIFAVGAVALAGSAAVNGGVLAGKAIKNARIKKNKAKQKKIIDKLDLEEVHENSLVNTKTLSPKKRQAMLKKYLNINLKLVKFSTPRNLVSNHTTAYMQNLTKDNIKNVKKLEELKVKSNIAQLENIVHGGEKYENKKKIIDLKLAKYLSENSNLNYEDDLAPIEAHRELNIKLLGDEKSKFALHNEKIAIHCHTENAKKKFLELTNNDGYVTGKEIIVKLNVNKKDANDLSIEDVKPSEARFINEKHKDEIIDILKKDAFEVIKDNADKYNLEVLTDKKSKEKNVTLESSVIAGEIMRDAVDKIEKKSKISTKAQTSTNREKRFKVYQIDENGSTNMQQ